MHVLTEHSRIDHALARIDARVKILSALVILAMILSYRGFAFPGLVTLICLILTFGMGVRLRVLLLRYSEPLFIAAVIIAVKLLFAGKDPMFSAQFMGIAINGYRDGFLEGLQIANRIVSAVSLIALLGFSTPFAEFIAGLSWFRVPKGFVEILMFAYRYIFVLFDDAQVIYQAQKNRLGYSTLRRGLSSFGTLAGSLTIKAFDHSQSTTVAMMQRGYDGTMPMLKHKPFRLHEVAMTMVLLICLGVLWKI
ncbi:MAG: cobalt ECF transporter T component CbiQ [Nitrospirota bacterium]|nr:cobalt ECF transporter T component CbiQ [Nitrospirota bacterium]